MMMSRFPGFLSLLVFLNLPFAAHAQDNHFLYIQSEAGQPFYAKMEGKLYSSTASGYIIISKLKRGEYRLSIGFPRNEFPEQEYPVIIADENQGLLLKDAESKKVLVNMESQAMIASLTSLPEEKSRDTIPSKSVARDDLFSSLLANVVKDSSLLMASRPVAQTSGSAVTTEKPEGGSVASVVEGADQSPKKETAETSSAEVIVKAEKTESPEAESSAAEKKSATETEGAFKRVLMVNQEDGQEMVYVSSSASDTIRLFVPGGVKETESSGARIIYKPEGSDNNNLTITPTIVQAPEPTAEEKKEETPKTAQIIYEPDSGEKEIEEAGTDHKIKATVSVNSDCTAFANEKDFLRLRRRMAGESDAMKMIDAARRFFKSKCYTTDQIRNLSYLFMDDEGRYQFFDAAYPHVSDSNLFTELESQLADPYYINRFKAMIQK